MHEHATRMYFKNIWAELSYEFWPSWHGSSFLWTELACAELVLGSVVRNSIVFAFHRYNEIFILEMR